jgi:hypothetical protein
VGEYSARDKLKAVEREIRYREHVYPQRVKAGKMTQRDADFQIDIFKAIAAEYKPKADAERASGDLFGRANGQEARAI